VEIPEQFNRLRVVLVNPRNPLNIGAAARAMSNFGFLRMRVVTPYDAGYREARSAVGASEVLMNAEEFASLGEAIADCTLVVGTTAVGTRELHHRVKALPEAGTLIRRRMAAGDGAGNAAGNVALLFGSERVGLSNEEMSHCHWLLRIPTRTEHRSMNLGQAVAVCMYELARLEGFGAGRGAEVDEAGSPGSTAGKREAATAVRSAKKRERKVARIRLEKKPATAGDVERITGTLLEALQAAGYLTEKSGKAPREKIRRLIRRHELTANDADLWLSMLGQILYTLRKDGAKSGGA
jgi:TrmH family RNA methyltransferase